jgi:hypothetical protein
MKDLFPFLLGVVWLTAVGVGMEVLRVHDSTPGGNSGIPSNWPTQSHIPRLAGLPTLVMFAHPECPCTRASIGELALLMTHCQNKVDAHVVFLRPAGSGKDWLYTDLWDSAEVIPEVSVAADDMGAEAGNFHVTTSGHVVLYDSCGKLLFSGGITEARGHYGDNEGVSAIMNRLNHEGETVAETPVFGCSLVNPPSKSSGRASPCLH